MASNIKPSSFYQFTQDDLVRFIDGTIPDEIDHKTTDADTLYKGDFFYSIKYANEAMGTLKHTIYGIDQINDDKDLKKHVRHHIAIASNMTRASSYATYIELIAPSFQESYEAGRFQSKTLGVLEVFEMTNKKKSYLEDHLSAFISNAIDFPDRVEDTCYKIVSKRLKAQKSLANQPT